MATKTGRVVQVIGPVIDAEFATEDLPEIYNALEIKAKRVTFKYGLGDEFIGVLKTLHMLGLDKKEKINVKGVQVAPRDVVAACLPDPAHLGERMHGKTCAGTWATIWITSGSRPKAEKR